jgi:pseudaminic acid biosynthesis-associated methylase
VTEQLEHWKGEFGRAYTDRNVVDAGSRIKPFRVMLEGLVLGRILEVGCNRGHNLLALRQMFPDAELFGIEPNSYALGIARDSGSDVHFQAGTIFDLPFENGHFDLVLTVGVLIHIALQDLTRALKQIHRVSRRCILAVEYFAEEDVAIHYRGHDDLLWKRNFPRHFQRQFPDLDILRGGYWTAEEGFDRAHWWLFGKRFHIGENGERRRHHPGKNEERPTTWEGACGTLRGSDARAHGRTYAPTDRHR